MESDGCKKSLSFSWGKASLLCPLRQNPENIKTPGPLPPPESLSLKRINSTKIIFNNARPDSLTFTPLFF